MTTGDYCMNGLGASVKDDYSEAINNFKAALDIEPNHTNAKEKLFSVYCSRGNERKKRMELDLAIADYTEAIELTRYDTDSDTSRSLCARAYTSRGIAHDMSWVKNLEYLVDDTTVKKFITMLKDENKKAIDDFENAWKYNENDVTAKELINMANEERCKIDKLEQRISNGDSNVVREIQNIRQKRKELEIFLTVPDDKNPFNLFLKVANTGRDSGNNSVHIMGLMSAAAVACEMGDYELCLQMANNAKAIDEDIWVKYLEIPHIQEIIIRLSELGVFD